ncbi:MAG: hypothetical protein LBE24_01480 [Methylobacillus sp.]|jgi:hypothetical protein|nr:hypothetical protein [Methylobacillus sp.]
MSIPELKQFFLYCTLFNYAVLMIWFIAFMVARDGLRSLHTRWFRLSAENFDAIHYAGIAVYKIGILLLNLIPLLALYCMD